jgi:hypothetical protein
MQYLLSLFVCFDCITHRSKNRLYNSLKNDSTNNVVNVEFIKGSTNYSDNLNFIRGFDLKHGLEKENDTLLTEIKNNFIKKDILEKLKNSCISTFEKIETIDNFDVFNDSMKVDFYKGGLTDDWNFTI